ncbi:MAG TPA: adenylate/guanylate cyclase domain-containing protein [Pyrinomonadaceae bacterium]|nr:adenylate/guanylate cyclase domain-containing protein [Pyrinomonadaceae bacterium]
MFTIQEIEGLKRQWKLSERGALTIGRAYDNDIRVDDLRVSRHHAVIRSVAGDQAFIRNVSSGNLLLVNGQNVSNQAGEHLVRNGDEIRLTPATFTVVWEEYNVLGYTDEPLSHSTVIAPATSGFTSLINTTFTGRLSKEKELEELRRKAEMLAHLCDMSAALSAVFDQKSILDYATDVVMRMIQADCCAALLIEQDADLQPVSIRFRDEVTEPSPARSISRTAVRTAIEKSVMLSSQDVLVDENLPVGRATITQGIRSLACAPLAGREGVYGALYVDRRGVPEPFTELDTQLLAAVAAQAATAVESARAHERVQRETLARAAFARFMPEHIIRELVECPEKFHLGGTNRRISVLFCDVRGFARLAHRAPPETIVDLLNILFTEMAAEIFAHQGTLNKYLGDGLMALFGAPVGGEQDAFNAVSAAIGMQRKIKEVNLQLAAKGLPKVTLGIGINTGEATVGCIGAEQRSEYTAIGDTVNIASRIEGIAHPGQVLVTDATAQELAGQFPLSDPSSVEVKHIDEPVKIYTVKYETGEESDE